MRRSLSTESRGLDFDLDNVSHFLSDITLTPNGQSRMAGWRKRLFALLSRDSTNAAQYLQVPSDRAIAIGTQLDSDGEPTLSVGA